MSFGYYILTKKKVDFLKQQRFRLLNDDKSIFIYFLEFEGLNHFTDRTSNNGISLTQTGLQLFQKIRNNISDNFLFSYVLLENNESELDFAKIIKNKLNDELLLPIINSGHEIIQLREIYLVKYK